jgi:DNA-nicking Smr family endonuclease
MSGKDQPKAIHHPARRDLWTEASTDKHWGEYLRTHPLNQTSINVDRVARIETPHRKTYTEKNLMQDIKPFVNDKDWKSASPKGSKNMKGGRGDGQSPRQIADEKGITIILSSDDDSVARREMHIKPSAALRTLFNDYAEDCGLPVRSLRFAFNGSTLFLSSLGRKSAKDLNISDRDCISVSHIQETASSSTPEPVKQVKQSTKFSKKSSTKKQQKKKRGSKPSKSIAKLYQSEEKAKEAHSIALFKIFEEAEPIFKIIRQKLNILVLDCKSPKTRRASSDKTRDASPNSVVYNPNTFGLSGKAGKTSYTVNVGQVENLYISSKRNSIYSKSNSTQRPFIDLHGFTKDEAITKLDAALVDWVDTAMKGEYPWVIPVEIICDGGSQILSETVETWIKGKNNVANEPKGSS